MQVEELRRDELLTDDPTAALIHFAGQRVGHGGGSGMGLLRKHLVEHVGVGPARIVFTKFGFADGWRLADVLRGEDSHDGDDDWRQLDFIVHALAGCYRVEPGSGGVLSNRGVRLLESCEAEQHIRHFGKSATPTCWVLSGLFSGYFSRTLGAPVHVVEESCIGKGDPTCRLIGRTRAELLQRAPRQERGGALRVEGCLDASLAVLVESMEDADRKVREQRERAREAPEVDIHGLVAKSLCMRELIDLARRVARVDSTVLVTGESGAGKERIARLIHAESARAKAPYIAVNCGAITETLLESELFGHARGAFTGATQDRAGLFEAASHGTLLLDEIGEVSPGMQVKLLRALQEREIRRVGESKSRPVDVRVIAATNRSLDHGVEGGTFRQDLYYRLKVVNLHVPALRDRADDILPLARVMLAEAATRMKRDVVGLGPGVGELLVRYAWPGNVRELGNAMERAVALARGGRVEQEDLPSEITSSNTPGAHLDTAVRLLGDVERDYILAALAHNEGNQATTARQLGIGTATLYRKLKQYRANAAALALAASHDAGAHRSSDRPPIATTHPSAPPSIALPTKHTSAR